MITWLVRGGMIGAGVIGIVGGFIAIAVGPETVVAGLWGVGVGLALIVFAFFERGRYQSSAAEKEAGGPTGPGGGEVGGMPIDARFQPTDEVFIDPASGHRMRVLIDPRSGERRYVAEA